MKDSVTSSGTEKLRGEAKDLKEASWLCDAARRLVDAPSNVVRCVGKIRGRKRTSFDNEPVRQCIAVRNVLAILDLPVVHALSAQSNWTSSDNLVLFRRQNEHTLCGDA